MNYKKDYTFLLLWTLAKSLRKIKGVRIVSSSRLITLMSNDRYNIVFNFNPGRRSVELMDKLSHKRDGDIVYNFSGFDNQLGNRDFRKILYDNCQEIYKEVAKCSK